MKPSIILYLIFLALLCGCASHAEVPQISFDVDPATYHTIAPDLKARYIQEGVFVITHTFPWDANSLAVVMGDHLILVDTPWTPEATKEMLDWLGTQLETKEILAINTHFHLDNLGGNAYLVEQGISIYGSDFTVELLNARGQDSLDQSITWLDKEEDPRFAAAFRSLRLTAPTEIFPLKEGLHRTFDGNTLQVFYPGPGHTPDNLVVYFPEKKLLFGGCLIIGWEAIGNTADADLANWATSVQNLMQYQFDMLIPGHGERLDPELLDHTLHLLSLQND